MKKKHHSTRGKIVFGLIILGVLVIELRLFYWQIIRGQTLKTQAKNQSTSQDQITGNRGRIFWSNGQLLVGNQPSYQINLVRSQLQQPESELKEQLASIFLEYQLNQPNSEHESEVKLDEIKQQIQDKLDKSNDWVSFDQFLISQSGQDKLADLDIQALKPELKMSRYYPEASMAAHLTGFVGKDAQGRDKGYFGVEGALDKELSGRAQTQRFFKDALGLKLAGQKLDFNNLDGRDVTLTIRRDLQHLAETQLQKGIIQYAAKKGEIVIMDPQTGAILALATWPQYDQAQYRLYDTATFKNPSLAEQYEPGSTFKTLTSAAGIDAGVITPDTPCSNCSGPRVIGGYTIRTWNDEYHPQISMTDALAKSDNTAMIFIAEQLGAQKFLEYMKKFRIGQPLDVDLQEDTASPFPGSLGPVELATTSFGQGISTNSLQLTRAVSAIANQGKMMKPTVVSSVYDPQTDQTLKYQPQELSQVISPETAQKVTKMMVKAAAEGEAKWIGKNYNVAGKTGTSQIPSPSGGYLEDATIASFIGFAPPHDPKFVMMVKLTEPGTSPWAAETAAPLWFKTAEKIFLLLGITQN